MFRLDIQEADWCLGMSGSIQFRPLPDGENYRLWFGQGGLKLAMWDKHGDWTNDKDVVESDILSLLDETWTWSFFECAWQAFAEGMKRQKNKLPPS